jgi:hypothetical protein
MALDPIPVQSGPAASLSPATGHHPKARTQQESVLSKSPKLAHWGFEFDALDWTETLIPNMAY